MNWNLSIFSKLESEVSKSSNSYTEARTILFWLWFTALTLVALPHGNLNFCFFHRVNKSQIKNVWSPFVMKNPTVLLQLANQVLKPRDRNYSLCSLLSPTHPRECKAIFWRVLNCTFRNLPLGSRPVLSVWFPLRVSRHEYAQMGTSAFCRAPNHQKPSISHTDGECKELIWLHTSSLWLLLGRMQETAPDSCSKYLLG